MERSKACLSAFFDDAPNTFPSLFSGNCKSRNPVAELFQSGEQPFNNADFGQIPTGRFLYHLIQQSKGVQLTAKVSLLLQQVMIANSVSDDVVQYVSSAPGQADITPEEYRDTLRAHCEYHWDWSPLINFAHEYFSHLGLAMYNPSGPRVVPVESGDETPHFQSLEEIEAILERFVYQAFAVFWDDEELTKRFATLVNSPANCLLLSHDAHKNLEEMCWAIEAIENVDRGAWDYCFVKVGGRIFPYEPADGTRIKFGAEGGRFKNNIPLPSPELCNLRLAVTRVMRLSGAAEVVESWKYDYDDGSKAITGVLGHPYTDMVAMELLHARLGSINA
ncbi:hypothetical protein ARMSODRAFT_974577 [Armillaria solidipes]|uniref:Uncharacterized protein n=1 Tax=Armillaria solidipes TaxID=1076256 RepID=A0A2H3BGT3_9AGAR|nr:hypothetical protein ARMSODRAFT_974577 [Armillaria solidipes]